MERKCYIFLKAAFLLSNGISLDLSLNRSHTYLKVTVSMLYTQIFKATIYNIFSTITEFLATCSP